MSLSGTDSDVNLLSAFMRAPQGGECRLLPRPDCRGCVDEV
jgi:hypothetical protein